MNSSSYYTAQNLRKEGTAWYYWRNSTGKTVKVQVSVKNRDLRDSDATNSIHYAKVYIDSKASNSSDSGTLQFTVEGGTNYKTTTKTITVKPNQYLKLNNYAGADTYFTFMFLEFVE